MTSLLLQLWPELLLVATACVLLVLGSLGGPARARSLAPVLSTIVLAVVGAYHLYSWGSVLDDKTLTNALAGGMTAQFIKALTAFAGILFVLLAWPTRGTGGENGALAVGGETAEYFALLLLSLTGLMLTAGANNLILLFLAIELASIPTYIMVSISRPLPVAQEAGVKYFFLGALSAAVMLLGFSYLYGVTGTIHLEGNGDVSRGIHEHFSALARHGDAGISSLTLLALVLVVGGLAFKMAAFPLHVYAADVYQGAASPLTALLSYVPKAAGLTALVKILLAVAGDDVTLPRNITLLIAVIAVLTMTVGNVMALLQYNIKRVMAYSSVAHSGYMLAGLAAFLALSGDKAAQSLALGAVLFYLAMYALMNTGVFAVLQQIPARPRFGDDATPDQLVARGAASAETFDELSGTGRRHPVLGLCMAICALALVGLPATSGFLAKLLLAKSLLAPGTGLTWLLIAMMLNSAVSAAYYLRLPAAMFFRPLPSSDRGGAPLVAIPASLVAVVCAAGVLVLGTVLPTANRLSAAANDAAANNVAQSLPPATPATPTAGTTPSSFR